MSNSGGRYEGSTPDSITPVVGIRAWQVMQTLRKETRLFSVYKSGINWPVKRRLQAQCIQPASIWKSWVPGAAAMKSADDPIKGLPAHEAPYGDCTCGIYALNSILVEGETIPWQVSAVIGVVLLWGHVLEGKRGYRAQFAKVVALWMNSDEPERVDLIAQMAEMYGVPIIFDLASELEGQRSLQGGVL